MLLSASPAPVALFAYRRPNHLARTIEALRLNPEARSTILYVFCDGARDTAAESGVEEVRSLLSGIGGFAKIHVIHRETNFGLARNIIEGISQILSDHERVIAVEDDIVVSPYFLRYMNEALQLYDDEPRVGSISGYAYPTLANLPESYFIRGADCWGWATWRDRWRHFEADGRRLLTELDASNLSQAFDFDGAMGYRAMLVDQIEGRNDSWAVRWHASCFLKNLLILYPGRSLVRNIGNDGTGTHSIHPTDAFDAFVSQTPIRLGGIEVAENAEAREAIRKFHRPEAASLDVVEGNFVSSSPRPMWRRAALRLLPPILVDSLIWLRDYPSRLPIVKPLPVPLAGAELPPIVAPKIRYRGLHELDRQIEKYIDLDNGFFVELGANDGLLQSNTWYYETYRGWRGVLIEPAPNLFLECRRNRSDQVHIACAACVSFGFTEKFVKIVYANAMSVSMGVETDIADPLAHAELGRQFLRQGETVFTFGALARPLNAILADADAPKEIDLLSLDVEGAEIEVLRGIDHTAYRFRHMLIECRDIARLEAYLTPIGYQLSERFNEHDYLFRPTDESL